jgi:SAM-dependent methyltransferase
VPPESKILKSTERFTDRVADYVNYRPHYPQAVFEMLREELGFRRGTTIADIGSGTGISTKPLLELGCTVYAVEPNAAMRNAAELWLGDHPRMRSVAGTAEETTLSERTADAILAAQAFHWFDAAKARQEFARILRPAGWVVLLGNHRLKSESPFDESYDSLVEEFAIDLDLVKANELRSIDSVTLSSFFAANGFEIRSFRNNQDLDFDGLKGRLLSSSYAPKAPHPNHAPMISKLREIFDRCSTTGTVRMVYETNVRFGRLDGI